jgi:hypothetical protein
MEEGKEQAMGEQGKGSAIRGYVDQNVGGGNLKNVDDDDSSSDSGNLYSHIDSDSLDSNGK